MTTNKVIELANVMTQISSEVNAASSLVHNLKSAVKSGHKMSDAQLLEMLEKIHAHLKSVSE